MKVERFRQGEILALLFRFDHRILGWVLCLEVLDRLELLSTFSVLDLGGTSIAVVLVPSRLKVVYSDACKLFDFICGGGFSV